MFKRILLVSLIGICSQLAIAQNTTMKNKFIITDARINQINLTQEFTDKEGYIAFYTVEGKDDMYMTNYRGKTNSQSYGRMYDLDSKKIPESESTYEIQQYSFKWSYKNSYDGKSGTADVRMTVTVKPAGNAFEITIVPENLDVLVFKGYEYGTVQLVK
jgi:hypothetical protein